MRFRSLASLASVAFLASCNLSGDHAGSVSLKLNGPGAARAVTFRLVGSVSSVSVASGLPARVFVHQSGDTTNVMVVADQGSTLGTPAAVVALPDTRQPPTITVLQVAAPDYSLEDPTTFTLTILGPD